MKTLKKISSVAIYTFFVAIFLFAACSNSYNSGSVCTHEWETWIQTSDPTCTEAGIETRICTKDNSHKETRLGATALGHDWNDWVGYKEATVDEEGEGRRYCSRDECSAFEANIVEPHDHTFGVWVNKNSATCTEKEEQERSCVYIYCIKIELQYFGESLGHDWSGWEINTHSISKKNCSRCHEKVNGEIGDTGPAGGKIFYVAPAGFNFSTGITPGDNSVETRYYLEAAPANMPQTHRWINGMFVATNIATATAIGSGKKNTALINATDTDYTLGNVITATRACLAYGNGTQFSDWFLPSKDELNELYLGRVTLGIPLTGRYWSSSNFSSTTAVPQDFSSGSQLDMGKSNTYNVRAVRAF